MKVAAFSCAVAAFKTSEPLASSTCPLIQSPNMFRIASVNYLNARPLIHGLESLPDVELSLEVPSKLLAGLRDGRYDVALLPVIDYQRLDGLTIIPASGIG